MMGGDACLGRHIGEGTSSPWLERGRRNDEPKLSGNLSDATVEIRRSRVKADRGIWARADQACGER